MICCTLFLAWFGLRRWAVRPSHGSDPMAWRPEGKSVVRFSWAARAKSFGHAWRGLRCVLHEEHNARLHLGAAITAVGIGLLLRLPAGQWAWIILSIALVFFAEILNTAIEHLCDVVSPGPNPSVAKAKDIAAAGVLVCAVAAVLMFATAVLPSAWAGAGISLTDLCGG